MNATAAGTLRVRSTECLVADLRLSDVAHLLGLGLWLGGDPMREQCLVDLKQGLLVVHKQVKQMTLVTVREVGDLDPVLCQLRQPEKTLLKLFGFFRALLHLLELLPVVDLVLKTPLHDLLAYLLDAIDEKSLQLVLFRCLVDFVGVQFLLAGSLPVND